MNERMNDVLLTCDKKLTKSQLSPTHASTKRKITDELKHNAGLDYDFERTPRGSEPSRPVNIKISFWVKENNDKTKNSE